ncbi:unnamed protein product [Hapterophycus canaliculatus]
MAASVAARCLRGITSMACVARNGTPPAKASGAGALVRRNGQLQVIGLLEPDHAKWESSLDLLAALPRGVDGVGVDAAVLSATGFRSPPTVVPIMEAVNRNARRPKKANHGKRPCSHVGRRYRRRRKNIIKNGP